MQRMFMIAGLLLVVAPSLAAADAADLTQTIHDLQSQTGDKRKLDKAGVASIELSQIDAWLQAAANAAQEGKANQARLYFDRTRAQLTLIDALIELSKVEQQAQKTKQEIQNLKQANARAKARLDETNAKIRAMQMKKESK
ncbi:MAG: hypothetical protein ACPGUV_03275 [Polyangiales bacterium]